MKAIIVLLIIVLLVGGVAVAWDAVKLFAAAFMNVFISILPFLDIEQPIICKLITILIVQLLCGAGFYISHKVESTIGKIVSGIADVIATLLLFIA